MLCGRIKQDIRRGRKPNPPGSEKGDHGPARSKHLPGTRTIRRNPAARGIAGLQCHREIKEGNVRAICRQLEIPQPSPPRMAARHRPARWVSRRRALGIRRSWDPKPVWSMNESPLSPGSVSLPPKPQRTFSFHAKGREVSSRPPIRHAAGAAARPRRYDAPALPDSPTPGASNRTPRREKELSTSLESTKTIITL